MGDHLLEVRIVVNDNNNENYYDNNISDQQSTNPCTISTLFTTSPSTESTELNDNICDNKRLNKSSCQINIEKFV